MRRFTSSALGLASVVVFSLSGSREQAGPPGQPPSQTPPGEVVLKKAVRPREVPPRPPDEAGEPGESLKDYVYSTGQAIQFYTGRVAKNPQDYISYRVLGELYYRRAAGEGGGLDDFARAEAAFRKSLAINAKYIVAQGALAGVLCQRHQFAEALELAREVRKVKPRNHEAMAITADALIEMGRYDEGEQALNELARLVQTAPVLARQANLAELRGKLDEAERLTRAAIAKIRTAGGSAADQSWYQGRLGDLALAAGRLDEADALYRAVPKGCDAFHDATAGRARIAALRGRLDEAIALYEKAIAIGPDPHMLAAVGDLYLATGRKERAESTFAQLLKVTDGRPEYLREQARFLADHDRDLPAAPGAGRGRLRPAPGRPRARRAGLGPVQERPCAGGSNSQREGPDARHPRPAFLLPCGPDPRPPGRPGEGQGGAASSPGNSAAVLGPPCRRRPKTVGRTGKRGAVSYLDSAKASFCRSYH